VTSTGTGNRPTVPRGHPSNETTKFTPSLFFRNFSLSCKHVI